MGLRTYACDQSHSDALEVALQLHLGHKWKTR